MNSTFSRQDLFTLPMVFSRLLLSPITISWSSCSINLAVDTLDLQREERECTPKELLNAGSVYLIENHQFTEKAEKWNKQNKGN